MSTVSAAGTAPISPQTSVPNPEPEKVLTTEQRTQIILKELQTYIREQLVPHINQLHKEVDSLKERVKELEDPQMKGFGGM